MPTSSLVPPPCLYEEYRLLAEFGPAVEGLCGSDLREGISMFLDGDG